MRSVVKPYAGFLLGSVIVLCAAIWMVEQSPLLIFWCSALVLVAGLPHGAYDWVIMRAHYKKGRLGAVVAGYVALVLVVIALWLIAPLALLSVFLAYSAYHFGDSDLPNASLLHQLTWGLAIIGLPGLFAGADVQALFSILTETPIALAPISALGIMGCIAAFIHVCCAPKRWVSIGLLAVYGAVCWAAGALAGFACYFALLHSPIHLTRWRHALNQQGSATILMLSLVVMSAIAGAVWMSASDPAVTFETFNQTTFRYTFIALAALTVPHMVLLSKVNRRIY